MTALCAEKAQSTTNKKKSKQHSKEAESEQEEAVVPGRFIEGLPMFSKQEVGEHNTLSTGVWVTYKLGVYDITEFIRGHPGGAHRIMMAAGSSIEPFWALYQQHQTQDVYKILEEMRIGNLSEDAPRDTSDQNDPYRNEPERPAYFDVRLQKPFNAEPQLSLLVDNFLTPNSLYYVRNHFPVPSIDVSNYFLDIGTIDGHWVRVTLPFLKSKFPHHTLTVTTECAGNRRADMAAQSPSDRKIQGLPWGPAAISTATWTGVLLRDVINFYQLADSKNLGFELKHIHFIGSDNADGVTYYAASVPAQQVLCDVGDVLLAFEMNGEPIPRDHGFPLRVIVPGSVGARNVKWLRTIMLTDNESTSHWQKSDYKVLPPGVDLSNVTHQHFMMAKPIHELPVISAICVPGDRSEIDSDAESIAIKGYAYAGGGRQITRVDISTDGGQSWIQADLIRSLVEHAEHKGEVLDPKSAIVRAGLEAEKGHRTWEWTIWTVDELPLKFQESEDEDRPFCEVTVRAVDESFNIQPETSQSIWNVRGFLNNSWHRIRIFQRPE